VPDLTVGEVVAFVAHHLATRVAEGV